MTVNTVYIHCGEQFTESASVYSDYIQGRAALDYKDFPIEIEYSHLVNPNVAVSRQSRDDLSNKHNRYIFICCNDDEADTIKNSVKTAINEYNLSLIHI